MHLYYFLVLLPYFVFAFLGADGRFNRLGNHIITFLLIPIILFVSLRYDGIDYFSYHNLYYSTSFEDLSFPLYEYNISSSGKEFVFATTSSLFRMIGFPFEFFIFFIGAVTLFLKSSIIQRNSFFPFLALFVCFSFTLSKDMGQIRNALSAAIVFYAFLQVHQKNYIKFYGLVILASLIQIFSILALPIYALVSVRRSEMVVLFLLCSTYLSVALFSNGPFDIIYELLKLIDPSLATKMLGYTELGRYDSISILGPRSLIYLALGLIALFILHRRLVFSPLHRTMVLVFLIGLSCNALFSNIAIFSVRASDLLVMLPLVFVIDVILKFFVDYNKIAFFALYYCLLLYSTLNLWYNFSSLPLYQNLLF